MYSLLRKSPWKSSTDEKKGVWSKLIMVFTLNVYGKCSTHLLLSPIQDGHFRDCSRMWRGGKKAALPKICHTYPTMMKLGTVIPYLKKIQKIYESRNTPLEFCWHQHFPPKIRKFCYIKKYRYRLYFDS